MFTQIQFLIILVLLYMAIGLVASVHYLLGVTEGEENDPQWWATFITRMLFFWPVHFYLLVGVWLMYFFKRDNND